MKPFVFLGPTLPVNEARAILDAFYLPPVSMGDIFRLMSRKPTTIAIIDGLFEQTPAVWHKEILFALRAGVRVLGSSSMGALRAAELAAFGMEGVGEIFDSFHRGELEDDDEVAVIHGTVHEGYRCLSEAMVNLRAGLREARDAHVIGAETHDRLTRAGKMIHYPDRSWPRLWQVAAADPAIPADELAALRERVGRQRPDVKRSDAIRLLHHLGRDAGAAEIPRGLAFDFEPTYFWEQMILQEDVAAASVPNDDSESDGEDGAGEVSLGALRRHVRLHPARGRDTLATALLLYLADEQAVKRGIEVAPQTPSTFVTDSAHELAAHDRGLFERGHAAIEALIRATPDQVSRRLPAALARLGRLRSTLAEVRRKQQILRSLGLRAASPPDAGVSREALLAWYQEQFGPFADGLDTHASDGGYASVEEFVAEVALEYLAAK